MNRGNGVGHRVDAASIYRCSTGRYGNVYARAGTAAGSTDGKKIKRGRSARKREGRREKAFVFFRHFSVGLEKNGSEITVPRRFLDRFFFLPHRSPYVPAVSPHSTLRGRKYRSSSGKQKVVIGVTFYHRTTGFTPFFNRIPMYIKIHVYTYKYTHIIS